MPTILYGICIQVWKGILVLIPGKREKNGIYPYKRTFFFGSIEFILSLKWFWHIYPVVYKNVVVGIKRCIEYTFHVYHRIKSTILYYHHHHHHHRIIIMTIINTFVTAISSHSNPTNMQHIYTKKLESLYIKIVCFRYTSHTFPHQQTTYTLRLHSI